MRVLSVIHGPDFGGAHNQALRLGKPLAARGAETVVALPDEAQQAAERLRGAGIDVVTLPLHRLRATASPIVQGRFLSQLPREVHSLQQLIHSHAIDVVQAHGPTNPHAAIAARREHGVAVVWQLLDTRAPKPLRRAAMPVVVRLADAITTWGQGLVHQHPGADALGERLIPVYPPVDTREFVPSPARRAAAREELGVDPGERLIGFVGALNPQKGHEHLIRAASMVVGGHPGVQFRVLGASSSSHTGYERELSAEVARLGLAEVFQFMDPGDGVPRLLPGFDLFVMSSVRRSEGMPTSILEAMACGLPVVSTDVGAVRELVEDGVTGLLVPAESPAAIARAVVDLLADGERREALGAQGRRRAVERWDLERLADLHLRAYEAAISHRARGTG